MYACMYVCMYVCMYLCIYVCMYMYVCICMYVCTYVVRQIRRHPPEDDNLIEAEHTYRGHTGPLFALTTNNALDRDKALLYSAGSEGIIRIWKLPP